jgi:hypothetical protein
VVYLREAEGRVSTRRGDREEQAGSGYGLDVEWTELASSMVTPKKER